MKRVTLPRPILTGLAVLTATAALLTPATAVAAGGAGGGVLAGTWTSTDVPDGSHQTLTITGSGNHVYSIVYVDDEATGACGGRPARLSGPGFVDGDSVLMVAPLVCLPGGNALRERLAIGVQYDPETDSLVDDFGIVWSRAD
jgi:hypothetical protein